MNVLLLTAARTGSATKTLADASYRKLLECQRVDRFGIHRLTDDPARADVILFAENDHGVGLLARELREHEYVRRYRERCFVYNASDQPLPFLPGIYASIEARWHRADRVRAGHYLSSHITVPPLLEPSGAGRDLLFSFVGAAQNAPVRGRVARLRHPRGHCEDTSAIAYSVWTQGREAVAAHSGGYAAVLARSKFALCPRGLGTSSMRLFESMRAGCVPVILSDEWVAPTGPDWSSFSVRVAERDVERVPQLLEALEHQSESMGRRARQAWLDWFSDEVSFHRVVEWCGEIRAARRFPEAISPTRLLDYAQLLRPVNLRRIARTAKGMLARGRAAS